MPSQSCVQLCLREVVACVKIFDGLLLVGAMIGTNTEVLIEKTYMRLSVIGQMKASGTAITEPSAATTV
jgi:hypothetical protein